MDEYLYAIPTERAINKLSEFIEKIVEPPLCIDYFKKEIIEAIRWLPTAVNRQDYAVVFKGHTAHVYCVGTSMLYLCDGGIAMAHVEIACNANSLEGHWERLDNLGYTTPNNWKYLASFVCK